MKKQLKHFLFIYSSKSSKNACSHLIVVCHYPHNFLSIISSYLIILFAPIQGNCPFFCRLHVNQKEHRANTLISLKHRIIFPNIQFLQKNSHLLSQNFDIRSSYLQKSVCTPFRPKQFIFYQMIDFNKQIFQKVPIEYYRYIGC